MSVLRLYPQIDKKDNKKGNDELYEQFSALLLDIQILTSSLSTVADLMMDAGVQCDSVSVGSIIGHYTQLISDGIGKASEIITFQKEADS